MSTYLGNQLLSGVATNTISNAHSLLDFKWTDHILNEMSWLRADTFSWQSGAVYVAAYNHLVADASGTAQTETIGSYTITYYRANDGHKVVLADQEQTVTNIYNESGVAWYYILDTTNTRFKLPRTKWGFTGLRDAVGTYVPESLPNIKGAADVAQGAGYDYRAEGAFAKVGGSGGNWDTGANCRLDFNASRSSSAYQDNAPVQQRSTQMYLYFYVGDFSQSATEQTAGLNSELFNGKLDLDVGNATSTTKEIVVGWGMPDYSAVITGISFPYTAPSNGIMSFNIDNYGLYLTINSTQINVGGNDGGNEGPVQLPLSKGDVVQSSQTSYFNLIFIPLKGV